MGRVKQPSSDFPTAFSGDDYTWVIPDFDESSPNGFPEEVLASKTPRANRYDDPVWEKLIASGGTKAPASEQQADPNMGMDTFYTRPAGEVNYLDDLPDVAAIEMQLKANGISIPAPAPSPANPANVKAPINRHQQLRPVQTPEPKKNVPPPNPTAQTASPDRLQQTSPARRPPPSPTGAATAPSTQAQAVIEPVSVFTTEEMIKMLKARYDPVNYRGGICPTNGGPIFTIDSIKTKRERMDKGKGNNAKANKVPPDKVYKTARPQYFGLDSSLKNHVSGKANLAIYTRHDDSKFIAFDLDDPNAESIEKLNKALHLMITIICTLGLVPFVFFSGKKGFHVEAFFNKPVDVNRLNDLNLIIVSRFKEQKGQCLDKIYPSANAYRVFGAHHYETRSFTTAIMFNLKRDLSGNIIQVELEKAKSVDESWQLFADATINDSSLLDNIIEQNPVTYIPEAGASKRAREHARNYSQKPFYYNEEILKVIHETGLYGEYKRHFTSYQLGRYYRHCLNLTENQARDAIEIWLQRHYKRYHPFLEQRGITPFSAAACQLIKSDYAACCYDTVQNCVNGYKTGKPFEREKVEIFHQAAFDYLNGLEYSLRRKKALIALLDCAMQYSSLDLGLSFVRLLELFNAKHRDTLVKWLSAFQQDNILVCISKGSLKTGKTSVYRLMLPDYCYQVLEKSKNPSKPA